MNIVALFGSLRGHIKAAKLERIEGKRLGAEQAKQAALARKQAREQERTFRKARKEEKAKLSRMTPQEQRAHKRTVRNARMLTARELLEMQRRLEPARPVHAGNNAGQSNNPAINEWLFIQGAQWGEHAVQHIEHHAPFDGSY